ncbi:unnamed protein product, partial [Symbiodinium sp. KB8]
MTPRAKIIEDVLYNQPAPIDPQCSFCERHRGYAEHLGADKHWRALYPDFTGEGVCIEKVRPRAWNKWRIMGGWIRINELDGAIELSKGNNEPSSGEPLAAAPQMAAAQGPQGLGPQGPQGPPGPWSNYQPTQQQATAPPMPQQASQPAHFPGPQPGGENPWAGFSGVAHMQSQPNMPAQATHPQMPQPMQPPMQPQMPMQQQQQQMQQPQMPQPQMPPQAQTQQAPMPQPGQQSQAGPGENGYTNYHSVGQFGQPAATPYPQGFHGNPTSAETPPWQDMRNIRGLRRDEDSMSMAGNAGTRSEPGDTRESDSCPDMLDPKLKFAYAFYRKSMQQPAQAVQAALMKYEVDPQQLYCSVCRQHAVFGSEAIPPHMFAAHLTGQGHFANLQ